MTRCIGKLRYRGVRRQASVATAAPPQATNQSRGRKAACSTLQIAACTGARGKEGRTLCVDVVCRGVWSGWPFRSMEKRSARTCRHTLLYKPIGLVGSAASDAGRLLWAEFGLGTLVSWWLDDMKQLAPERARLLTRLL